MTYCICKIMRNCSQFVCLLEFIYFEFVKGHITIVIYGQKDDGRLKICDTGA